MDLPLKCLKLRSCWTAGARLSQLTRHNTPPCVHKPSAKLYSTSAEQREEQDQHSKIRYTVSTEDFKWVQRVLPPSRIPVPPKAESYPTPSGWCPPADTPPDLPYYVNRTRYHDFPVVEKKKGGGRRQTIVHYVDGDIWALEKDLIELVRPHVDFDPATRVHEQARFIMIKGLHKDLITNFLQQKGF